MFDYAIVGAGSAGCVLAHRLSADPKLRVALIEAGPAQHRSLKVRAPGMYQALWRSPLDWAYSTTPQEHVGKRRMFWPRGKVVGGTSCLNAMVYIRGHRDNYDAWRDAGNPGWGWADVLPYFKKSEDNVRGASALHGAGGPLAVDDLAMPTPVSKAFVEATAKRCNVRITDDFNGEDQEGAGIYQHTTRGGLRVSTGTAYLDPIRDRKNLVVITDALALGLVILKDRAMGVRIRTGAGEQVIEARETILCGGAIGSAQLLMLSGIGARDELTSAGVTPVHELPGVGKHLEDHLLTPVVFEASAKAARTMTKAGLMVWLAQHLAAKKGPLATSPVEAGAFVRSQGAPRPDHQFHFIPFGLTPPNTDEPKGPPFGRFATILPGLIYPRSRGEIRLAGKDPAAAPLIDPKYFSDPADLDHLVDGVRMSREIAATEPLASLLGPERNPGPQVTSEEQVRDAIRLACNTIFHPVGTCRMGDVVDHELRVRGIAGLCVADASIMPSIVGGNTNAPVIMIAEKAADMLLAAR